MEITNRADLSPSETDVPEQQQLIRKRKRVSVACKGCRTRKTRCDGGRPKCATCIGMNSDCLYEVPQTQPSLEIGNRPSTDIEGRLSIIEHHIRSSASRQSRRLSSGYPESPKGSRSAGRSAPVPSENVDRGSGFSSEREELINSDDEGHRVDGMGAVPLEEGGALDGFYGASSNVSFLHFLTRAMGHMNYHEDLMTSPVNRLTDSSLLPEEVFTSTTDERLVSSNRTRAVTDLASFPTSSDVEAAMQYYFSTIGLMVPCLHEGQFRQTYRHLKQTDMKSARKSWLAMLYMILALSKYAGAPTSPSKENAESCEIYFQKALALSKSTIFRPSTFETVQLFLLMTVYLQGSARSTELWTFHALAVKSAYQIGLHSPKASSTLLFMDQQLRQRTWCWCVMNDRVFSATLGRPCLIPQSHVQTHKLADIAIHHSSSRLASAGLAFFEASITLGQIMGQVVDQLYDQNLGSDRSLSIYETFSRTFSLRWELAEWQQKLPTELRIIESSDNIHQFSTRPDNTRFRVLLSLRFFSTQILALRPVLHEFLKAATEAPSSQLSVTVLQDSGVSTLLDLLKASNNIIFISNNILAASDVQTNLLGAWWFSSYYTFNASLAILGILVAIKSHYPPDAFLSFSAHEMRRSLANALEILQGFDKGSSTILKYRNTLQNLVDAFDATEPLDNATFSTSASGLGSVDNGSRFRPMDCSSPYTMNFGTFEGVTIDTENNFFTVPRSIPSGVFRM